MIESARQRVNRLRRRSGTGHAVALVLLTGSLALAGCTDQTDDAARGDGGSAPGVSEPLIPLTHDARADGRAILDGCDGHADLVACGGDHLKAVLGAVGSEYAFEVLGEMADTDATIRYYDHRLAHILGRHALDVYGALDEALASCSHRVGQGCFHGALQEHFERVGDVADADLDFICPSGPSEIERFGCVHGLGHGLMPATGYDLGRSLELCTSLEEPTDQGNCYGGAFMENIMAYNHQMGTAAGHEDAVHAQHDQHDHGGDAIASFWVDPDDPLYPCHAVAEAYRLHCWRLQTSLILSLNGGDFQEAAGICAGLEAWLHDPCFRSLGRDAATWSVRQPAGVSTRCAYAPARASGEPEDRSAREADPPPTGAVTLEELFDLARDRSPRLAAEQFQQEPRVICVQGAVSEVITNYGHPAAALPFCAAFPEEDKAACYSGLGRVGTAHLSNAEISAVCARAEDRYVPACQEGIWLGGELH